MTLRIVPPNPSPEDFPRGPLPPPPPEKLAPRVLAARVDWLTSTFRVEFDAGALSYLRTQGRIALREDTPAAIVLGRTHEGFPRTFRVLRPSKDGRWILQSSLCNVEVLEHGPGAPEQGGTGWNVTVHFSGTELLAVGWRAAVLDAEDVAGKLGKVLEGRLGRVDLCADVASYVMRPRDRECFVKRSRVGSADMWHEGTLVASSREKVTTSGHRVIERIIEETGAWHVARPVEVDGQIGLAAPPDVGGRLLGDDGDHVSSLRYVGSHFTGFTFGSRTSLSARIYDKRLQLRAQGADKQQAEHIAWRRGGWNGIEDVTRVEFELRGEALDELFPGAEQQGYGKRLATRPETGGAERRAELLGRHLDPVWGYCGRTWLRLVARRRKASTPEEVQERWRAVQGATFVQAALPAGRVRSRGGAKCAQTLGCALSQLASTGELPSPPWEPRERTLPDGSTWLDVDRLEDDPALLAAETLATDPEVRAAAARCDAVRALVPSELREVDAATLAAAAELEETREAVAARRTYQAIRAIAIVAARQIVAHQIERAGSSVGAFARLVCMWQASLARFPAARHGAPVPEQEKPAAVLAGLFGHGMLRQ